MLTKEMQDFIADAEKCVAAFNRDNRYIQDFLVFLMGEDACCIELEKIYDLVNCEAGSEILDGLAQTRNTIDYQGRRLPVIDMRRERTAYPKAGALPVMVVLQLNAGLAGIVVDSVTGVCRLSPEQISPVPDSPSLSGYDYFKGLAFEGDKMLIIVDIECLMFHFNVNSPVMAD